MAERVLVSSGSPFEKPIGFSRAVSVGNVVAVAGTVPLNPDGTTACLGDVYGQTKKCLEIALKALKDAGGAPKDTIRTRILLTDIKRWKKRPRRMVSFFP